MFVGNTSYIDPAKYKYMANLPFEEQEKYWGPMIADFQELCDYAAGQGGVITSYSIHYTNLYEALGLETCATLGMLKDGQAEQLKDAGLQAHVTRSVDGVGARLHHVASYNFV